MVKGAIEESKKTSGQNDSKDHTSSDEISEKRADLTNQKSVNHLSKIDGSSFHTGDEKFIKDRGVYRVEALKDVLYTHEKGLRMRWILGISILLCSWAISLDWSVTSSIQPWATSAFKEHSLGLGALAIAQQIITAISKPVWAQIANIVSRPTTYFISIVIYTLGYIIVASSHTISAYIVGAAFSSAGNSGIQFLNSIIVADMTPLKWRGLATSALSTPFIINTWYAGYIVSDLGPSDWRWGYGMFCVILPVVLSPAAIIMFVFESRAHRGLDQEGLAQYKRDLGFKKNWKKLLWRVAVEVDILGLLLLGFGFSLVLLPFSLYQNADNQWKNPSLIAMFIVGGIFLIVFIFFEFYFAPFPILPKRCLNRTLVASVTIDFMYQFAGNIPLVYLSSYAWIVRDWDNEHWTYFNNTLTMGLCVFGVVAGILMRLTHRFKIYQYFGVIMAILGSAIMLDGRTASDKTVTLVWASLLDGIGGGFCVPASQVALQASIPHRDMAISVSILSLTSSIGSSIGSAISTAIWQGKMESALRKYMPASVSDDQVITFFKDITTLRQYDFHSDVRQAGIRAYRDVNWYFYVIATALQVIRLIAVFFQRNYYLGDSNNAVEDENGNPIPVEEQVVKKSGQRSWKKILLNIGE
ncbi:hypothetical protein ACI3LY_004816 [Candidozyma auris]|uniref:Major facilitator superfamily (MFS) profile domain-containing protein n=2 Tax=Candidozyma auris TaxID=498019 RepID=A0AB36WA00_CANAR|nr:hypothetical protein QG37_06263 [[Candida] auris]PIS54801.1 hypothetical protein B9J08_002581 [[Candida] auris]PIS55426.1 hypothetical protein CJI97_002125 [[Candida] auris]QWW25691.1 hypothetical protein CA7LBN_004595 [[Candida] auris]